MITCVFYSGWASFPIESDDVERIAKFIFEHQEFGEHFSLRNEGKGTTTTIYCDTEKRSYEKILEVVKDL